MDKIKINSTIISTVNGPGKRFVIWVQGCHMKCKNCENKQAQNGDEGQWIDINELIDQIPEDIDGISFSGGEPLEQLGAIITLIQKARLKYPHLNVLMWTGWICSNEMLENFKKYGFDIVIDGPYLEELHSNDLKWRGSTNQRIFFISDRVDHNCLNEKSGQFEVFINPKTGTRTLTGFIPKEN